MIATVLETLEAIAFARKFGVDPAALLDFLTSTLFNAPVYKTYGGLILEGKFEPAGFVVSLGLKDIRLVLQAAEALSVPLPLASVIRDRLPLHRHGPRSSEQRLVRHRASRRRRRGPAGNKNSRRLNLSCAQKNARAA